MEIKTDKNGCKIALKYGKWVRVTKSGLQKTVHAPIPYDSFEKLVELCRTNKMSVSFVIRSLVQQLLNGTQPTLNPDLSVVPRFNENATTTRNVDDQAS